jgi:hypothetical protein
VIYIYGLTAAGEVTTHIIHSEFTTEAPYEGNDVTYDINVEVNRAIAKISITPSHEGVAYFNNLITREDFELYGGDVNRAADAVVAKIIEDYAAWDYTLAETFEYNTDYLATEYEFEAIANTEYLVFAFKWNEKCERLSEVSYKWFEVGEIPPSENVISVNISDITQSTFYIETTTTTLDPYVIFPLPQQEIAKMHSDKSIFNYIMNTYGTSGLAGYICEGDVKGTFSGLQAGTEYAVLTFGYEAGTLTTAIIRNNITTLGSKGCLVNEDTFIPAIKVKTVDTTGAGDSFNGVLAACLAEGLDIDAACRYAVIASGISVGRRYVLNAIPYREEIERKMKDDE